VNDDRDGSGSMFRKTFDADTTFYLNSTSNSNSKSQMHMARTGLDYYINDKTTVGISGSFHTNKSDRTDDVDYSFLDNDSVLTSTSFRNTLGTNEGTNYNVGLTLRKTFSSPKHLLTADAFYSKGDGTDASNYDEQFFDADNILIGDPLLQFISRPSLNTDASIGTDYVHPFKNGNQLETGIKYTKEIKDNTLYSESFDDIINDWDVDDSLNNQFIYNEDVVAAYLDLEFQL
jgi:hypothetical protein